MTRLYERMRVPVCFMVLSSVSDGEGGTVSAWSEGRTFAAAIVHDGTTEDRVAEKEGAASTYTVTCSEVLDCGNVIKRLSDGQCFRIVSRSEDGATPKPAMFSFTQASAERWELPDVD